MLLCGQLRQQSLDFGKFSFLFIEYYSVWSSGRDRVIRLYLKIIIIIIIIILLLLLLL